MKNLLVLFCLLSFNLSIMAQETKEYNPAEEFEMKTYYMGFLKAGPKRNQSEEEANRIQQAHLLHIKKMSDDGKLAIAGPFLDKSNLKGIFIFNTETFQEAEKLANEDPAVKAGRLVVEIKPWMAAKGTCLP